MAPSHRSFAATVAEVTIASDGAIRVDRVVTALHCGLAVNPDNVRAQIEGATMFGLSVALHGEITFADGAAVQTNFDEYQVLRMNEAPKVEAHIVDSSEPPTGASETPMAPLAPAIANAIFAATGQRLTKLPLRLEPKGITG